MKVFLISLPSLIPLWFSANIQLYHGKNKVISTIWWDDNVIFALDQHALLDFSSASSLKQQSMGTHVTPRWQIILNSEPTSLFSYCCLLSREAANTNFIIFGLTGWGVEPMIYWLETSMLTITPLMWSWRNTSNLPTKKKRVIISNMCSLNNSLLQHNSLN